VHSVSLSPTEIVTRGFVVTVPQAFDTDRVTV